MIPITYLGAVDDQTLPVLLALHQAGHNLTLAHSVTPLPDNSRGLLAAVVVDLNPVEPITNIGMELLAHSARWLGWNRLDRPALAVQAYQAGASAVLPSTITPNLLLQAIARAVDNSQPPSAKRGTDHARPHRYRRGDLIVPDPDAVVEVQEGVIALSVIHHDGAAVLLGLCGPGQSLLSHPHDSCSLQLVAHTETAVAFRAWRDAASTPDFSMRLSARLQHLEAWAAMQARPHLDQRIRGLLSLLAEQFGERHPEGLLINIRLTHAQLASAVGATRTTITRTLGDLRARGLLTTIGSGDAERFCLREPEHVHHTPPEA